MQQVHAFRLKPGQDLKKELQDFCLIQKIQAAVVISGVGSLKTATLRFADAKTSASLRGPFEIVSLTGTLGAEGLHLHIALSDAQGQVLGGHLMQGCAIHTTAEIVLLEDTALRFKRVLDSETGYKELQIEMA